MPGKARDFAQCRFALIACCCLWNFIYSDKLTYMHTSELIESRAVQVGWEQVHKSLKFKPENTLIWLALVFPGRATCSNRLHLPEPTGRK